MAAGHVILMTSLLTLSAAQSTAGPHSSRLRLVSNVTASNSSAVVREGRLEVYYQGQWGTVCDHGFSNVAATVACRALGFNESGAALGNLHGPGTGNIWLDDVQCTGNETSLDSCLHNGWGDHTHCQHTDDVSIACYQEHSVRLVGSQQKLGRLEIFHNGTWGTVCDDGFYSTAATVACYSLGFGRVGQRLYSAYQYHIPASSTGPIWMHYVQCIGNESSLVDCSHSGWGVHDCTHIEDVVLSCVFPLRLVGGNASQGRLEVHHNGEWGTVCDHDFDDLSATVACHQLGFPNGGRTLGNAYGPGAGRIWLDDVVCFGHETQFTSCRHRWWGSHNCQHSNDVSIICDRQRYECTEGTMRLEGSEAAYQGRLEICHNGTWGTVCSHGFDNRDARVACRGLGLGEYGYSISNYFGPGSGRVWLHGLLCYGNESSLVNCRHSGWGTSAYHCSHSYDVSVSCSNTTAASNTTHTGIRLVGGRNSREGRLEVRHNGIWGTVCDDSFDDVDARVVCYSLGFGYVGLTLANQYGRGSGTIWLDDVECIGYETSIDQCRHNGWGYHNCGHSEDVSIACHTGDDAFNGTRVRLVGGTPTEGRLEVYHGGVWGTVCDDSFDNVDARVVCNELGFGRVGWPTPNRYGFGHGRIWLDDLGCLGTETFIGDCHHGGWGRHNCGHYEDVAVACYNASENELRLVSNTRGEGRLEIFHNGTWGTVCNDVFDDAAAQVACYSLGFGRVGQTLHRKYLFYTFAMHWNTPVWLDGVDCTGSEDSIVDCKHREWGINDCNHNDDVSIACYDNTTFPTEWTTVASTTTRPTGRRSSTRRATTQKLETTTTTPVNSSVSTNATVANQPQSSSDQTLVISVSLVVGVFAIILIVAAVVIIRRRRRFAIIRQTFSFQASNGDDGATEEPDVAMLLA